MQISASFLTNKNNGNAMSTNLISAWMTLYGGQCHCYHMSEMHIITAHNCNHQRRNPEHECQTPVSMLTSHHRRSQSQICLFNALNWEIYTVQIMLSITVSNNINDISNTRYYCGGKWRHSIVTKIAKALENC